MSTRTARRAVAPRRSASQTSRWSRRRGVVGAFAAFAALGFVAAYVGPIGVALADVDAADEPVTLYASSLGDVQTITGDASAEPAPAAELDRGTYSVYVKPKPTIEAKTASSGGWRPPFVTPDPGSAQAIAYDMVKARGWSDSEFACLVALWKKESGWRVNAYNAGSGAYGIPQALPGKKMASAGADWETSAATQITWGLGYVSGRYGTPCGAWGHSQSTGWY
ncbi:hypothetical protein GCM10025773_12700 [Microbacterium jejuense]